MTLGIQIPQSEHDGAVAPRGEGRWNDLLDVVIEILGASQGGGVERDPRGGARQGSPRPGGRAWYGVGGGDGPQGAVRRGAIAQEIVRRRRMGIVIPGFEVGYARCYPIEIDGEYIAGIASRLAARGGARQRNLVEDLGRIVIHKRLRGLDRARSRNDDRILGAGPGIPVSSRSLSAQCLLYGGHGRKQ